MSTSGLAENPTNKGVSREIGSVSSMCTGSRCTTFTKLPLAFSGGSSDNAAPVPAEPGHPAVKDAIRIGVDMNVHVLADAKMFELGFLEVGVDPHVLQRQDRQEHLPRLNVIARIDGTSVDEPAMGALITV